MQYPPVTQFETLRRRALQASATVGAPRATRTRRRLAIRLRPLRRQAACA